MLESRALRGAVAQLGERRVRNAKVEGSIPFRSTIKPPFSAAWAADDRRKARGLTQAALGKLAGLDQTRIAKIERNPRLVSVGQLMQLLSVLHVHVLLQPVSEKSETPVCARPSEW